MQLIDLVCHFAVKTDIFHLKRMPYNTASYLKNNTAFGTLEIFVGISDCWICDKKVL